MEFASSSSKLTRKYDVLINSQEKTFTGNLFLTTFLHQNNAVNPILHLCRVAIVVFTKTYSESAWCLHQLQQIIQWHQTYRRHVLPVYYEIQPYDVCLQKGDFAKAFKATAHQTF